MSKLKTKDLKPEGGSKGVSKTLKPGNVKCTINSIILRPFKYKPNGLELVLSLEGPDMGKDFEGFFIDKNNESLGRHKGQVGQVKAAEWAFADAVTKGGTAVNRDQEIIRFLTRLCVALDIPKWLDEQDDKYDTIEELVAAFNTERPFAGKVIEYCIAGKEYLKGGYSNYDLFLPKVTKAGYPFGKTGVVTFNEAEHIRRKKVEAVDTFDPEDTGNLPEFNL